MKKTLPIIALALAAAAAPADARVAGGGGATSAPQPVAAEDFRLVIKEIAIFDDAGAELDRFSCRWTEPQDDDMRCIEFSGDPQQAYKEIKAVGGSSATVHTEIPDLDTTTDMRIAQRSDGTWLFKSQGKVDGRSHYAGWVCSADGRTCSGFRANSSRKAKRAIKAATARVKKRSR